MSVFVTAQRRLEYWLDFTSQKYGPFYTPGGTVVGRRYVTKVKILVMNDDELWQAVVSKHSANDLKPEELKQRSPETYQHSRATFWQELIRVGVECGLT